CPHRAAAPGGRADRRRPRDACAARAHRPLVGARAAMNDSRDRRLGWLLVAPALALILLVSLVPIAATTWEALHAHDLRLPWLGRPFVGIANFVEAVGDPRFGAALLHTVGFAAVSVPLELALGLALAMVMHTAIRARAAVRT